MMGIPRLAGMRDLVEQDALALRYATERIQGFLGTWGYTLVDTPLLEPTELFLRKSGGELATKMYTFTDPGGRRVSLRPEFTSSVIRRFVERQCPEPYPWRWHYAGPVFRYEEGRRYHQFTQVGAELLGCSQPSADAEALALALGGLHALGFSGLTLVLGDIATLTGFLDQFSLSERAKLFLLSSIPLLRDGEGARQDILAQARTLGLLSPLEDGPERESLAQAIEGSGGQALMQSFWGDVLANPVGSRSREEILARYMQRLRGRDDPAKIEAALDFLGELCLIRAEPPRAIAQAERLAAGRKLSTHRLKELGQVLETFASYQMKDVEVVLDLGLTREITYYTGIVFEVRAQPLASQAPSLCGGGRYDGLIKALGAATDVPALGFAYSLEDLLAVLPAQDRAVANEDQRDKGRTLVSPEDAEASRAALQVAETLRLGGERVETDLEGRSQEENLDYARSRGITALVTVDSSGQSRRWWIDAV